MKECCVKSTKNWQMLQEVKQAQCSELEDMMP